MIKSSLKPAKTNVTKLALIVMYSTLDHEVMKLLIALDAPRVAVTNHNGNLYKLISSLTIQSQQKTTGKLIYIKSSQ